jgi:two-component system, cell cycle response regulator
MDANTDSKEKRTHHRVCLLGFSPEQTAAIGVYCRFASRRNLTWSVTDQAQSADGILVRASNPLEFERYKAEMATASKVVVVGASSFGSAWQHVPSPLSLADALVVFDYFLHGPAAIAAPVTAPVAAPAAPAAPVAAAAPPASDPPTDPPARPKKPLHVLIVANSDATLKLLQGQIERFGHSCQLAHDGEEALVLVAGQKFQFVFLDANIAGLDCFQTCRAIKQNKSGTGSPAAVVLMASRIGAMDKIRGNLAGCDAHIIKPLNDGQLAAMLAAYPMKLK